jgi:hypothetical protein
MHLESDVLSFPHLNSLVFKNNFRHFPIHIPGRDRHRFLGKDYEEVRYEGRWIALDSWDGEKMALYVNKGGSYQEEVRRTYQHDGTSATKPFPDIHCSEWASDTDNQGPWSGNVSTNDVRDLKFTVGDNQDDDDESLVFDYIRVYVR